MLVFLNSESIEHFFPRCDEFRLRGYPWFLAGIGPPAFRGENKPPSSLPLSVACDVTLSRLIFKNSNHLHAIRENKGDVFA